MRIGPRIGRRDGVTIGIGGPSSGLPANAPILLINNGQSNQLGKMQAVNVTVYPGLTSAFSSVLLTDHNAGANSDPPSYTDEAPSRALAPRTLAFQSYLVGDAGTELVVGRDITAAFPLRPVRIGKMCVDGSSLVTGWNNPAFPTAGPSYLTQMRTFITARIAEFGIVNPAEQIIFSWNQGEADVGNTYDVYLAALQSYIGALQSTFGNFRVHIHRLTNSNDNTGFIRAAQESYIASLGARGCMSYGDDLPLRDAAHYTDDAYATIGVRTAAAEVVMLNATPSAAPVWKAGGPPFTANSAGSLTPQLPLHQAGDVFIMVMSALGNTNYPLTDAQGFAELPNSPQHNAGSTLNSRLHAWWKRVPLNAAPNSQTPATIGDVASDDFKIALVCLIRGCRTTGNPFDVTAGDTAVSSTVVSVPGVTTTVDNCLVMAISTHRLDVNPRQFSGWGNTDLANVTQHVNQSTTAGVGFGIGIAVGTKAAHGAVGATTATLGAASDQAHLCIALAPP